MTNNKTLINKNSLSHLPTRDKEILQPFSEKKDFTNDFKTIIAEKFDKSVCFFLTVTFIPLNGDAPYRQYKKFFEKFRQRIDNGVLPNSKAYKKAPHLFLVPESGPALHFHGLLLIHKASSKKFRQKCVQSITKKYDDVVGEEITSVSLVDRIVNPYAERAKQSIKARKKKRHKRTGDDRTELLKSTRMLTISSIEARQLDSFEQAERCFIYSVKNFVTSEFKTDHIIIEGKENPKGLRDKLKKEHIKRKNMQRISNDNLMRGARLDHYESRPTCGL